MAKAPILDLDTLIERPTIRVNKESYELYSPEEISLLDSQFFTMKGREIEVLAKGDDTEALAALIDKVCRRCLVDMPDDVYALLSPPQRTSIVEAFTGLLLRRRLSVAGAIAAAVVESRTTTGAKPSPDFNASSAEIPTGGSAAPLQH